MAVGTLDSDVVFGSGWDPVPMFGYHEETPQFSFTSLTPNLRIAVDMDDVVADFWPTVVRAFNTEFGADLSLEEQTGWDDNPIKTASVFGPDQAYEDWWAWWRDRHWLWATCPAVPGAIGGLAQLRAQGHYVELITAAPEWARREKTRWLSRWHPAFDRLTFTSLDQSKAEFSDATLLIDDKPQNVQEWIKSGRPAILFRRPWNTVVELDSDWYGLELLYLANTWKEVLENVSLISMTNWSDD